jgi:uncharacterized protein (TIGR00251 family)
MQALLAVKVVPKSHKNEIVGWENNELKIRLRAVPEKGEANEELIEFLSKTFGVSKSLIVISRGETSRHKKVVLSGISQDLLEGKIKLLLS